MRELIAYWRDGFDWRAAEARLNAFPQFKTRVDDLDVHFLRIEGKGPAPNHCSFAMAGQGRFTNFLKSFLA